MGIWFRHAPQADVRSSPLAPSWLVGSSSYAHIDGGQIENAQQSIAIRSAVDLLASLCSELPIDIYSGTGSSRRSVAMPGYLQDPAGDGYGLEDWIYQVIYSWAYRGNLYGDILDRTPSGMLRQVTLFHPDRVSGWVGDNGRINWTVNGAVVDRPETFLHRRVNPVTGQVVGLSPITAHANSIGINLATTRFGKSFFDADAQPVGILRNTRTNLTGDQSKSIKDKFMAALRAGQREPIVIGAAYEWESLSVTPEDSQFLGTMGYSAADCARIFGPGFAEILGYETGATMTYSNVQDKDLQLLKYSVNRWLRRLERLLFQFLPRPQYPVFNRDALLETNTMQRYQAYASALGNAAWKTVDEVREQEMLPPMPKQDTPAPAPAVDPGHRRRCRRG